MLQCIRTLRIAWYHYRVVCLVSGELNDAAIKSTVGRLVPGQQARELVSCSTVPITKRVVCESVAAKRKAAHGAGVVLPHARGTLCALDVVSVPFGYYQTGVCDCCEVLDPPWRRALCLRA
jgi:hypothetical protein